MAEIPNLSGTVADRKENEKKLSNIDDSFPHPLPSPSPSPLPLLLRSEKLTNVSTTSLATGSKLECDYVGRKTNERCLTNV